jgi:hypothetical protein
MATIGTFTRTRRQLHRFGEDPQHQRQGDDQAGREGQRQGPRLPSSPAPSRSAPRGRRPPATVKSLRRDAHAEEAACWLHGEGWCLSRRDLESGAAAS